MLRFGELSTRLEEEDNRLHKIKRLHVLQISTTNIVKRRKRKASNSSQEKERERMTRKNPERKNNITTSTANQLAAYLHPNCQGALLHGQKECWS